MQLVLFNSTMSQSSENTKHISAACRESWQKSSLQPEAEQSYIHSFKKKVQNRLQQSLGARHYYLEICKELAE